MPRPRRLLASSPCSAAACSSLRSPAAAGEEGRRPDSRSPSRAREGRRKVDARPPGCGNSRRWPACRPSSGDKPGATRRSAKTAFEKVAGDAEAAVFAPRLPTSRAASRRRREETRPATRSSGGRHGCDGSTIRCAESTCWRRSARSTATKEAASATRQGAEEILAEAGDGRERKRRRPLPSPGARGRGAGICQAISPATPRP